MYKALYILLLLPFLCFSQEKKYKNDWEKYGLNGKVKTLKNITYQATNVNGKIIRGKQDEDSYNYKTTFNSRGDEINCIWYGVDSIYDLDITLYDEYYNKIQEISYAPDGVLEAKDTYTYRKGKLLEHTSFNKIQQNRDVFFYGGNGKKTQEHRFIDGYIATKIFYKYDTLENIIEEDYYRDNDTSKLSSKSLYLYNSKGQKIEYHTYNGNGSFEGKVTYDYDENGNEKEWANYYKDGTLDRKDITVCDTKGRVIEQQFYDSKGLYRKITNTYQYDKNVNWIKKNIAENGNYRITIREIEYY